MPNLGRHKRPAMDMQTKQDMQIRNAIEDAARAKRMEVVWSRDGSGDVCIRPMHFDAEGVREVRFYPDPCEFRPLAEVVAEWLDGGGAPMHPLTDDNEQCTLDRLAQVDRRLEEVAAENRRLRAALTSLLKHYVDIAESGDCGYWNPEEEEIVIAARTALAGGEQ